MSDTKSKLIDRVILLLVNGMGVEQAESFCVEESSCTPEAAARIVSDARKRVVLAAQFDLSEETGKAFRRLEAIYSKASAERDLKTALQAQREMNQLLGLYRDKRAPDPGPDGSQDGPSVDPRVAAIEGHLRPLGLAPPETPIEEVARLAVQKILELAESRKGERT